MASVVPTQIAKSNVSNIGPSSERNIKWFQHTKCIIFEKNMVELVTSEGRFVKDTIFFPIVMALGTAFSVKLTYFSATSRSR